MRLLIHGYNYAPELIGIGRYTGEMASWLAARGHQVTVLTGLPYYPEWRIHEAYRKSRWMREWRDGVEVLRAPLYVPSQVTVKGRLLFELCFGASSVCWWPLLFRRRWDAVIAICPPLLTSFMPLWLSVHQRIAFVFHFQDLQLDAARKLGMLRNGRLVSIFERLDRFLLTRADVISAISEGMLARLREKGGSNHCLHLFPNWADLENIQPRSRYNSLRRELGFESELMVLYAGNMGEKQGLEIILESARLTRERVDIRYVLAGEGATRSRIMRLAQRHGLKNILFLPLQDEVRFPLLLAAGDIHLVIQKEEASDLVMPSKLTNILAAGRPFIATSRPETELGRVTVDSQAGLLVSPQDGKELAGAILRLADQKDLREKMGKKARHYAEGTLNREAILRRFEDLLFEISNSAKN